MSNSLPKLLHTYQNHHLDSTRWLDYAPRADDIIVATSFKSGTTWMLEIVWRLIFLGRDTPPAPEFWIDARAASLAAQIRQLTAQTHRRLLKTHLPLDGLPFYPQVKYIVVGRDARDVFMSLWNHYSNYTQSSYAVNNDTPGRVGEPLPPCPLDIHALWQAWISRGWFPWESEGYPFWSNLQHTQSWWNYRSLENILFVHFNDLLTNLASEVRRIAHFLDIALPDEALPSLLEAVSLPAMRREAEQKYPDFAQFFQGGVPTFFFKGTNGRWREVLSTEEVALYEETATRVLTPACRAWLEQGRAALPSL